jgi:hypothetical protein
LYCRGVWPTAAAPMTILTTSSFARRVMVASVRTYTVHAVRADGWWGLTVPEAPGAVSQVRSLAQPLLPPCPGRLSPSWLPRASAGALSRQTITRVDAGLRAALSLV